jgi:hypothetical protein
MKNLSFLCCFLWLVLGACKKEPGPLPATEAVVSVGEAKAFGANETAAQLSAQGVVSVENAGTQFFIGYRQVSANNQDPILVKFVDGQQQWARTDYENTGDDQKGYGLLWDGAERLYAVFSATGTQPGDDFRRFASNGWLPSYGQGGGAKVAVLARIDPATGEVGAATFLYARLTNGKTNSMQVTDLALTKVGELDLTANAWFSPLKVDKSRFDCSGSSPFVYRLRLSGDLGTALEASAEGCG